MAYNSNQVFVNIKPGGLRQKIKPVKNIDFSLYPLLSPDTPSFRGKPIEGGLWTTDDGYTWTNHILDNMENVPSLKEKLPQNEEYWEFYHLTAQKANVFTVDSKDDYNYLKENYLLQSFGLFNYLNWEKISKSYDGISITKNGLLETKSDLYGWEITQTLWFRWVFESFEGPLRIPITYKKF